jgi:hypothetical protein
VTFIYGEVIKQNLYTLEELRSDIHHKISAISREELHKVNTIVFRRYTE